MSYLYYSFLHRKKYVSMYLVHLKSWDILQLTCEIFLYTRNDLKRPSTRQKPNLWGNDLYWIGFKRSYLGSSICTVIFYTETKMISATTVLLFWLYCDFSWLLHTFVVWNSCCCCLTNGLTDRLTIVWCPSVCGHLLRVATHFISPRSTHPLTWIPKSNHSRS